MIGGAFAISEDALSLGTYLATLKYSRNQEHQADLIAIDILEQAGVDPRGMESFFEKLVKEQQQLPGSLEILSTHPDTQDRIKAIRAEIERRNLSTKKFIDKKGAFLRVKERVILLTDKKH
jgi:predicted Zn-dependent protease